MRVEKLKKRVCKKIEENKDEIIKVVKEIYNTPETGYKETKTTNIVKKSFNNLDLKPEDNIAITGVKATIGRQNNNPHLAVLGELDALICRDHPDADIITGAVHACGHNNQIGIMLGVAYGLIKANIFNELNGKIDFMAVPAEEFIEMDYRDDLIQTGDNGFLGKKIQFIGQESHAGGSPEDGVNALNAAVLAINNINAQRETFKDNDKIRVHPIITKGGDVVNIVPSEVKMESYVRGKTVDSIFNANKKVNRAIKAGADAVGGDVIIKDIPGYLPMLNYENLMNLFEKNLEGIIPKNRIIRQKSFSGSFDMGDLSHIMPVLHPFFSGVRGSLHTRNFKIVDYDLAVIKPAKALAKTIIDILSKQDYLFDQFKKPPFNKAEYLEILSKMRTNE